MQDELENTRTVDVPDCAMEALNGTTLGRNQTLSGMVTFTVVAWPADDGGWRLTAGSEHEAESSRS